MYSMFPYNDEENAWISANTAVKTKKPEHSLLQTLIVALFAAVISTVTPILIYFTRTNL